MTFASLLHRLGAAPATAAARVPSLCAVCHGWGEGRVCMPCLQRFAAPLARCTRCGLQVPAGARECGACLVRPPPFAHTVAAVDYAYPWDTLITRFKFHAALDLVPAFTRQLLEAASQCGAPPPAWLLPVPLSRERLRERGYNQSWELARRLARQLSARADAGLLLRTRDTPHQLDLPVERRAGNVRSAFAVEPRRAAELEGRSVAIVDDVMTTGETAAEIARVLLRAGAAEVSVWVVARTPRPDQI